MNQVLQSGRYYIKIEGFVEAVFTEVTGLQVEITTQDYEEGGHNSYVHRLPGRAKYSNLTLKKGMTVSSDFLTWCMKIVNGQVERKNVTIVLCNVQGNEKYRWDFQGAYPVKWVGPSFNSTQSAAAIETLELAHQGISSWSVTS